MIYDDDIINDLVICVYTLVDGSRVIGEEVDYNYNNGYIDTARALRFPRLLPLGPTVR